MASHPRSTLPVSLLVPLLAGLLTVGGCSVQVSQPAPEAPAPGASVATPASAPPASEPPTPDSPAGRLASELVVSASRPATDAPGLTLVYFTSTRTLARSVGGQLWTVRGNVSP